MKPRRDPVHPIADSIRGAITSPTMTAGAITENLDRARPAMIRAHSNIERMGTPGFEPQAWQILKD